MIGPIVRLLFFYYISESNLPVTMDLQSVLRYLVDTQHSPRESYIEHNFEDRSALMRGIVISLDLRLERRTERQSYSIAQPMHLAFCGNVNVWVATPPVGFTFDRKWRYWSAVPIEGWRNTSNHDSCWASDGFRPLDEFYFDGCARLNEAAIRDGHKSVAPYFIDQYHSFSVGRTKKVLILHKAAAEKNSYTRDLVSISPMDNPKDRD